MYYSSNVHLHVLYMYVHCKLHALVSAYRFRVRLNRVGGWVVGRVCLKTKNIYWYIYSISSLSARSNFVLCLRSCLFREFPVVDKKGLGLGLGSHDPRPTHPRRLDTLLVSHYMYIENRKALQQ